jgi:serine/threonine protein kinase
MNVLIDDGHNAVLCDFGLSRIKADITSSTLVANPLTVIGSRNWMAPERLLGGSVRKPYDIYSFGMTIYEV